MVLELLHNLALLLSIAVVYELLRIRVMSYRWWHKLVTGLLFGTATVAGMLTPMVLASGVFYDGRSVILAVAGYLGGPVVAGLSAIVAGGFRIWLGGAGTGAGVATVVTSALLGTAGWYLRRRDSRWEEALRVWAIGVAVHVAMLLCQLLIPQMLYDELLTTVAAPVLLLYPLAFLLTVEVVTTFERRHDTQTALAQSEARYRSLFENGYVPMLIVDPDDGRIHDANAAAEHFYGWSTAELCEMTIQDINLLSPPEVKQEMERARASEQKYFQFRHRLRDGSVRNVAVYSGTVPVDGKRRLFSIVRDITDELAAQRELYLLRYSTENSIIGVFRIREPDGRIVYANRAARENLGYTAEELSSMTILDIDPSFNEESWREHRDETRRLSGKTFETVHRTRNAQCSPSRSPSLTSTTRARSSPFPLLATSPDARRRRHVSTSPSSTRRRS
ncbi:MAG: PAS domain S-box protein [Spirochaetes bacterium]|jgi:PAS domain S-box-containing protein|nr:PAS domain S-box protein [Spirochaetota bacterium]